MTPRASLVAFLLLLASSAAAAAPVEYDVSVQKIFSGAPALQAIAVVPMTCPVELECHEIEKDIARELAKHTKLRVVGAPELGALMKQTGVNDLQGYEMRMIIGESLGVDAFAVLNVKKAQVEVVQPNGRVGRATSVKLGSVAFDVLARDGTVLGQASGETYAVDSGRSLTNMVTNLFEQLLKSAWRHSD